MKLEKSKKNQPKWLKVLSLVSFTIVIIIGALLLVLSFYNLKKGNFNICDSCTNVLFVGLAGVLFIALPLIDKIKISGVEIPLKSIGNIDIQDIKIKAEEIIATAPEDKKEKIKTFDANNDFELNLKTVKEVEIKFKAELKILILNENLLKVLISDFIILDSANPTDLFSLLTSKYPNLVKFIPKVQKIEDYFEAAAVNEKLVIEDLKNVKQLMKELIRVINIESILAN